MKSVERPVGIKEQGTPSWASDLPLRLAALIAHEIHLVEGLGLAKEPTRPERDSGPNRPDLSPPISEAGPNLFFQARTSGQRIALLDSDLELVNDLEEIFKTMGYETMGLDKIIGASNLIRDFQPDLLVVEPELPLLSGAKLIQTLRQNLSPLPILILYSSLDRESLSRLAAENSADDWVVKNSDYLQLITRVKYLLSLPGKGDQ